MVSNISIEEQKPQDERSTDLTGSIHQETHPSSFDAKSNLSLVASLERTLFAGLNNVWLLIMAGIGLMSVGNDDNDAVSSGVYVLGM